jgi:hypothetical protein
MTRKRWACCSGGRCEDDRQTCCAQTPCDRQRHRCPGQRTEQAAPRTLCRPAGRAVLAAHRSNAGRHHRLADLGAVRVREQDDSGARRRGVAKLVDWLSTFPGDTWQQRWELSGVERHPGTAWTQLPLRWLSSTVSRPAASPNAADGVWGVVGKGAQRKQPQVEIDLLLPPADMHSPLGVDQLHAVADGDIRDMRFGIRRVILAQQEARRRPATGWAIGKRREGRR